MLGRTREALSARTRAVRGICAIFLAVLAMTAITSRPLLAAESYSTS